MFEEDYSNKNGLLCHVLQILWAAHILLPLEPKILIPKNTSDCKVKQPITAYFMRNKNGTQLTEHFFFGILTVCEVWLLSSLGLVGKTRGPS